MIPHLVKWHDKYAAQGLVIIDIDNGAIDALSDVQGHARSERLPYAVYHDAGGAACDAYGVHGYPSAYLVGRDGVVLWEGAPLGDFGRLEARIEQALSR